MAVKDRSLSDRVVVWSRRAQTRAKCAGQPWCDTVSDNPEEAVAGADLIIICSPVDSIVPLTVQIAPALEKGALVTDVGSAKSLICRHAHAAMPQGASFIGAHPMAGSERSGLEHASANLFDGKACFVTPLVDSGDQAVERVIRFWMDLGMEVTTVTPESHDEIVAHISHLPHVLATCLCNALSPKNTQWRLFIGNGLRDTTRIAAGSPALWKEIISQNREEILRALNDFENELQSLKASISNNNSFEIFSALDRAKIFRDQLQPPLDK